LEALLQQGTRMVSELRIDESAGALAAAAPLSPDCVTEFNRKGFLVFDRPQISAAEVEWCRSIILRLFKRGVGKHDGRYLDLSEKTGGGGGVTPSLFRPSFYAPELSRWAFRNVGLAIAKQLLGPDAELAADNTVYKPAQLGGPTPFHQDEAFNDTLHYQRQVSIWIAMYDTSPENGAMCFIPGSHRLGVLEHRLAGGASAANSYECYSGFDPTTAQVCPIPAGGMTIHHGCTIHGAGSNKSDTNRLGYIFNYKTPPVPRPELGKFYWNGTAAIAAREERSRWLRRGGVLPELVRILRSDRENKMYFVERLRRHLKRLGRRGMDNGPVI
jgi:hypothetical protein